jgi:hypothetical protein
MRVVASVLVLILGALRSAAAAPLNVAELPAATKWLVHIDLDALRAATIFGKIQSQGLDKAGPMAMHLARFHQMWNLDARKDLRSVTLFGAQLERHTGAVVLRGKFDRPFLVAKAQKWPDYQVSRAGRFELHTWTMRRGSRHEHQMAAAFFTPEVLVVGFGSEQVKAVLATLEHKAPGLSSGAGAVSEPVAAGTVFVMRGAGAIGASLPCQSPLLQQSEAVNLALGEEKGQAFFAAYLTAKNDEVAQQMKTVVEGMCASAALKHDDDQQTLRLIRAVRIAASGKTLRVEWRAAADAAWPHVEAFLQSLPPWHEMPHREMPPHAMPPRGMPPRGMPPRERHFAPDHS